MKGLILKDLYTLKSFAKQYSLIFGGMMLWSVFMKSSSILLTYAVVLGSMLVLSSMSMDENVSYNRYAMTMPISAETIVKAKYMLLFLTTAGGITLGVLFNGIMSMTIWRQMPASEDSFGGIGLMALITACIVADAFTLPVMFKLSAEKARYVYILVLLGLSITVVGLAKLQELLDISWYGIRKMPEIWLGAAMLIVCILALIVSYRVSLQAVKKKEW